MVAGSGATALAGLLAAEPSARRSWRLAPVLLAPFGLITGGLGASVFLSWLGVGGLWSFFPGGAAGATFTALVLGLVLAVLLGADLAREIVRRVRD